MHPVLENSAFRPDTNFLRIPSPPSSPPYKSVVGSDSPTAAMRPANMLVEESFEELPPIDTKIKSLPPSEEEIELRSPNVVRSPSHGSRRSKTAFSWRRPYRSLLRILTRSYWNGKRSINPMTPMIRRWDMLIFILLCFTATVTPYEVRYLPVEARRYSSCQ